MARIQLRLAVTTEQTVWYQTVYGPTYHRLAANTNAD